MLPPPFINNNNFYEFLCGQVSSSFFLRFFNFYFQAGGIGCTNDYVEVYDGPKKSDRRIGRYCTNNPGTIESTSNSMLIIFQSNAAVTKTGK